jgi:hypothetical protein
VKKYLLFVTYRYYPNGGVDDFINDYDSISDAIQSFEMIWPCIDNGDGDDVSCHVVRHIDMAVMGDFYVELGEVKEKPKPAPNLSFALTF